MYVWTYSLTQLAVVICSGVYYILRDMFRPFYNGHIQVSILGGVVNTIVLCNTRIRDLVSRAKLAIYYHILVFEIVVN
jgi:hypothetical protein